MDSTFMPGQTIGKLGKHRRKSRSGFKLGFVYMLIVVQPDAEDFFRTGDYRGKPDILLL